MDIDFILLLTTAMCMNMFNVEKYFVCIIILRIQFEKGCNSPFTKNDSTTLS